MESTKRRRGKLIKKRQVPPPPTLFRALRVEIDGTCVAVDAPADIYEWIQEQRIHESAPDANASQKRARLDALAKKMRPPVAEMDSIRGSELPAALQSGPIRPFKSVISQLSLPLPCIGEECIDFRFELSDLQPDLYVAIRDPKASELKSKFIAQFRFVLALWYHGKQSVFVTLEAEHSDGVATCTYSVPECLDDAICRVAHRALTRHVDVLSN